jgi:hypothetical protein
MNTSEQAKVNRMQKQLNEADNTERGLKCQIIRRRNERDCAIDLNAAYSRDCCAFAVAGILKEEQVWTLVDSQNMWKECSSASVGVMTTIGDYTNKKGETMKVHYSENGHFIEKCKKGDDEPKSYTGHFKITKERFRFVMNPEAVALTQLFVGRFAGVVCGLPEHSFLAQQHLCKASEAVPEDEDEAPLTAVAKKITIRMKKSKAGAAAAAN